MKTISRYLSLVALAVAACALPVLAQTPAASPAATPGPCESQEHNDLYTDYYTSKTKKDAKGQPDTAAQQHAFEVGQQFLDKYAATCQDKYTESVKKFVDAYRRAKLDYDLSQAWVAKDYAKIVSSSKDATTAYPDDPKYVINGAWGAYEGVALTKNMALTGDALNLAQRALQMLQAGKTSDNYFFKTKEEAQDWMEYVVGAVNVYNKTMADAIPHLVKVAQGNTAAKQEPTTYYLLAQAYTDEYLKLKAKYDTFKEETDESRIILANMNLAVDRIIDAYARAVAYSTKPEQQKDKATYMATLTELYKTKHNDTTDGLNDMIASITTKPLLITTPVTSVPAETAPAGTGDGNGGTKPPTTTTMPATTTPPAAHPAQPQPTPTPASKKPPVRRG